MQYDGNLHCSSIHTLKGMATGKLVTLSTSREPQVPGVQGEKQEHRDLQELMEVMVMMAQLETMEKMEHQVLEALQGLRYNHQDIICGFHTVNLSHYVPISKYL